MNTIDTLQKIGIGTTGFVASEVVQPVMEAVAVSPQTWVQAVTQVVIALATLVSLFRNKRKR